MPAVASKTPSVPKEITRYLRSGDHDLYFAAWPGDLLARARKGSADLKGVLVSEIRKRAAGAFPRALPNTDLAALTLRKIGPMVRGLFPAREREAVLAALERSEANPNNCSIVVKLTLGETTFLFPGDAEEEEEEVLLADPQVKAALKADVLKVPHHGSDTSSSEEFLQAVSPEWMVVSAGAKGIGTNKGYKHPRLTTIERLRDHASVDRTHARKIDAYSVAARKWRKITIWDPLFVTVKDGTVVLGTDGHRMSHEGP